MSSKRKRCRSDVLPSDAFAMMMHRQAAVKAHNKYTKIVGGSLFLPCPVGCGKRCLERDINSHLDECLFGNKLNTSSISSSATRIAENSETTESESVELNEKDDYDGTYMSVSQSSDQKIARRRNSYNTGTVGDDAFSRMMQHSRQVFSSREIFEKKCAAIFHLHSDGRVSWKEAGSNDASNSFGDSEVDSTQWSVLVNLKLPKTQNGPLLPPGHRRELQVSSSISSVTNSSRLPSIPRLVRRHSRLSVPVLKSILQKAIRRRRPLPAAKVAMELADKSLGDLLRRLPIIMLEDSTLHPDLPLLCWLMVAHSKDYVISLHLMTRVIQIVYEMASCPWIDDCRNLETNDTCTDDKDGPTDVSSNDDVILQSILLRASYGGMPGDMTMLTNYAQLWRRRFAIGNVPNDLNVCLPKAHISVESKQDKELTWIQVPELIHRRAKQQSVNHVTTLVEQGIEKLLPSDICIEGVDFHCSSILDHILAENALVDNFCNFLQSTDGLPTAAGSPSTKRTWLEGILKTCMWNYSSGVNHRRRLIPSSDTHDNQESTTQDHQLKIFWDTMVRPIVQSFMMQYVQERISKVEV